MIGEGCRDRHFTLYIHKGEQKDSIHVVQVGEAPNGPPLSPISNVIRYNKWKERNMRDPNRIRLCPDRMHFGANGGSMVPTTKGDRWWIRRIEADGRVYVVSEKDRADRVKSQRYKRKIDFVTIENSGKYIVISVSPNTTGKLRKFEIVFESSWTSETFMGVQASG